MSKKAEPRENHPEIDRRDFVRLAAAGLGMAVGAMGMSSCATSARSKLGAAPGTLFAAPPLEKVRVGFVGVGNMGSVHVKNLLRIEGVEMRAICDIVPEKVAKIQGWVVEAGQKRPAGYTRGDTDFVRMCEQEELDLVYTATPWRWHVPVIIAAMETGKHAATEVPAATTIDDCWRMVEASEKYRKHCIMMENCNYGRREMLTLNLVRKGLLGEVMHGECGYLHDLRAVKFDYDGEGLWRREHSKNRNGNLYPTHGLGPVSQCMNVNRGDQFDYLVSMSSNPRGLQEYVKNNFAPGSPEARETYVLGDINISLIKTALGRTIFLSHDTNLPRPYSRINLVQGTKGIVRGYPDQVHIEGRSEGHGWEPMENYYEEFEHPLWRSFGETGKGVGHGSMDYIEDHRLIKCLREGLHMDMDVYDAAALSAVSELSEKSVANRGQPMDFPDFTRGKWRSYTPLDIVDA